MHPWLVNFRLSQNFVSVDLRLIKLRVAIGQGIG